MLFFKLLCLVNIASSYQANDAAIRDAKFEILARQNEFEFAPNHLTLKMNSETELRDFEEVIQKSTHFVPQLVWYMLDWYQRTRENVDNNIEKKVTIIYNDIENNFVFGTDKTNCNQQLCVYALDELNEENIEFIKPITIGFAEYFKTIKSRYEEYPYRRIPSIMLIETSANNYAEAGKKLYDYISHYIRIIGSIENKYQRPIVVSDSHQIIRDSNDVATSEVINQNDQNSDDSNQKSRLASGYSSNQIPQKRLDEVQSSASDTSEVETKTSSDNNYEDMNFDQVEDEEVNDASDIEEEYDEADNDEYEGELLERID